MKIFIISLYKLKFIIDIFISFVKLKLVFREEKTIVNNIDIKKKEIQNLLVKYTGEDDYVYCFIALVYKFSCEQNLIYFKNNDLLNFADSMINKISDKNIAEINYLFNTFNLDDIRNLLYDIVLSSSYYFPITEFSPLSICKLVNDLLEIDGAGHGVADFGSGLGNFLAVVYKQANKNKIILKDLIGIEINPTKAKISQMLLNVLSDGSVEPFIFLQDALGCAQYPYTRAYTFPPIGMSRISDNKNRKSRIFNDLFFDSKTSSEWLFVDNMLNGLHKTTGRAVALVSGRCLFNNADMKYRNRLISSSLLEGVIELPSGCLPFTRIPMFVLVFSYGNEYIKFVDGLELANDKKRNSFIETHFDILKEIYFSADVKKKHWKEIINAANLSPSKILLDVKKISNGIQLGNIAKVFIGSQYTLGVFESKGLLANEDTGYNILTSSDIEDGIVNWENLLSVAIKDNKFDKFSIQYGDVIITSKSSKVKTAVVDIHPSKKILVTGGMIVIRPNLNKIIPIYLKLFLESNTGRVILKSKQKGSSICTLTSNAVSTIEVPIINIEKQKQIANKYYEMMNSISAYKKIIKKIEFSINELINKEIDYE